MTRVCFLGTPGAAVPTLERLAEISDVGLVVTQPDRPRKRSGRPAAPPVKEAAERLTLDVAQPQSGGELLEELRSRAPFDLGVVVAYGRILSSEVLELPTHGMLNVHFSLLPRWRGAAPVNRAVMAGDTMTGVTIIQLDEGLDTGPVLNAQAVDIGREEDAGSLTERLAKLGARLLVASLPGYVQGRITPVTQTGEGATYAEKISAHDRVLAVSDDPEAFVNRVRGLAPDPGATLEIDGERHKILAASPHGTEVDAGTWRDIGGWPVAGLDMGSVTLRMIHPPGRKPMSGEAWLRGRRVPRGEIS